MQDLFREIAQLLIRFGPWILFLLCFAETGLLIGLILPAELTVLIAGFLADRGYFPVWQVFAGTFFGALLGDQFGFYLGHRRGVKYEETAGRLARIWRRYEPAVANLLERHSTLAITLGRFISFVRTIMPRAAGMSEISYARFFAFDFIGVLGWAAGSVALGYLAGASWNRIASWIGRAGLVAAVLVLTAATISVRRRRKRVSVGP